LSAALSVEPIVWSPSSVGVSDGVSSPAVQPLMPRRIVSANGRMRIVPSGAMRGNGRARGTAHRAASDERERGATSRARSDARCAGRYTIRALTS